MLRILPVGGSPDADLRMRPIVRALDASEVFAVVDATDAAQADAVLIHGGTQSGLQAALAAAERGIPVVHVDAGRRDGHRAGVPACEPARRGIGRIASLHLAPTEHAERILLASGVPEERIVVTGDTVVDAVLPLRGAAPPGRAVVLIAAHGAEGDAAALQRVGTAVRLIAARFPHHDFVLCDGAGLALHAGLAAAPTRPTNIRAVPLLPLTELAVLVERAVLVVTDRAAIEEIAPTLSTPVLVLGTTTERPEGILAGCSRVIGPRVESIVQEVAELLADPLRLAAMADVVSPFGDGHASDRVVAALAALLGAGDRLLDFSRAERVVGAR
ncbi:UDP-N-acetylglucosamine 2-epimerase [Leifsonia sp. 2TAF2]|uniref:UDP-N-acetylglucosamine 2-epimerase n=1 Tax=Leifsonia sp. 2TAF2 TaxID=3233009 RepID=UPI003F9DD771